MCLIGDRGQKEARTCMCMCVVLQYVCIFVVCVCIHVYMCLGLCVYVLHVDSNYFVHIHSSVHYSIRNILLCKALDV